jgi:hypothetical protein
MGNEKEECSEEWNLIHLCLSLSIFINISQNHSLVAPHKEMSSVVGFNVFSDEEFNVLAEYFSREDDDDHEMVDSDEAEDAYWL